LLCLVVLPGFTNDQCWKHCNDMFTSVSNLDICVCLSDAGSELTETISLKSCKLMCVIFDPQLANFFPMVQISSTLCWFLSVWFTGASPAETKKGSDCNVCCIKMDLGTHDLCMECSPCTMTDMPLTVKALPTSTSSMICSQFLTFLLWNQRSMDCCFWIVVRLIVKISQIYRKCRPVTQLSPRVLHAKDEAVCTKSCTLQLHWVGHISATVEPIVAKHSWKNNRVNFVMLSNCICWSTNCGYIVGACSTWKHAKQCHF